jgi:hypothetical protein
MSVVVLAQEADFYAAIDAAESAPNADALPGLASPLGAAARGLTMQAWDAVRSALERVWTYGSDVLDEALATATEAVESIMQRAGDHAREVRAGLTAQLQVYISEHVDRSLRRVRGAIEVAGASLRLTGVSVAQSIQLSGSLKASISDVLALTAQGQILITAEYGPETDR